MVVEEGVVRVQTSPPSAGEPTFVELCPGPTWTRILIQHEIRSPLRVPVRVKGEPIGAISFGASQLAAYGDDDVAMAMRIADHVALAHQRLAEEASRAAQAQERASLLQDRVEASSISCSGGTASPKPGAKFPTLPTCRPCQPADLPCP